VERAAFSGEPAIAMRLRYAVKLALLAAFGVVAFELVFAPASTTAQPLETAVGDYNVDAGTARPLQRIRRSGASSVRIVVRWSEVAPPGASKPAGFDAADPVEPGYRWAALDAKVSATVRSRLKPLLAIIDAPGWAERSSIGRPGARSPDPGELALFARAAARRYSGSVLGLPRVGLWQLWNEPNYFRFLMPQFDSDFGLPVPAGARALSPGIYRRMLNAFSASVHAVSSRNLVIAGGTTPFAHRLAKRHIVGPMRFMRELMCLTPRNRPDPRCNQPASFDVWSHHPYTEGGPNHRARDPQSASLGDLPRMRRILRAAIRARHVASRARVRFWVTEFSWDTRPPDPGGVPASTHVRWVSEAMFRMWRSGVSLVTWFQLRDDGRNGRPDSGVFQSGLYFRCASGPRCDRPKPVLTAFRFPFVALPSGRRTLVWGRTPSGRRARVRLELRSGRRWRRVITLRADRYGIFSQRLRRPRRGTMRAVVGRSRSAAFRIARTRDRAAAPFGLPR
jgi:hypothetical protein